jgi:hypothetical protein
MPLLEQELCDRVGAAQRRAVQDVLAGRVGLVEIETRRPSAP